jgi:hypothetical protein
MPDHAIWALVADGTRARMLRGLDEGPGAQRELIHRSRAPYLRAALSCVDGHAEAPPESPLAADMRLFALCLCDCLDAHRTAGDFDALALFATRHMLTLLEEEMSAKLRMTVVHRCARNLVRVPHRSVATQIRNALRGKGLMGQGH